MIRHIQRRVGYFKKNRNFFLHIRLIGNFIPFFWKDYSDPPEPNSLIKIFVYLELTVTHHQSTSIIETIVMVDQVVAIVI